jgi:orotidine-5'-phosphate decarboxylase
MKKIILALDEIQNIKVLTSLVSKIGDKVYAVKVHNLYDREGPEIAKILFGAGAKKVWVDAKIHDIPNTGKLRSKDILGDIVTVHASGDVDLMKEVVASGKEVFAISVLTSLKPERVRHIYNRTVEEQVYILALLAKEAGVHGLVCSPHELVMLKSKPELEGLKFVTPGIRSVGKDANDQARIATPLQALQNGATHLVIGRQITQAEDPVAALKAVEEEIEGVSI